ncbi:unnamed protein product [Rotaria sordida]|uniref:Uncharacterized protein n=1 Tax=Rotaria sordida TaxID=392033 RepID=A0A819H8D8_9BILA|nr:unnamed protein product [Rotaria sordida]
MTTFKRYINTSLLPDDIFSYTDAQFYDIVKRIVGESAAELLEIQSIRSPDSLLLIPDVFAILNIKCMALNSLKEKIRSKSDNDLYIVKPGIKSLMNYFCELIIKKQDEDMKLLRKKKKLYNSTISSNNADSSDMNETSSDQQQQMSSSTAAKIVRSTSTVPVNENYHRTFILKSITNWCQRHSSKVSLSEGVDYHLFLTLSSDTNFTAKIKCRCEISVTCTTIKNSKKKTVSNKNAPNRIDSNINVDTTLEVEGSVKRSATHDVAQKKRFHHAHSK